MIDLETYPDGYERKATIRYASRGILIELHHKAETLDGLSEIAAFCYRNRDKSFLLEHEDVTYTVHLNKGIPGDTVKIEPSEFGTGTIYGTVHLAVNDQENSNR